MEKRKAVKNLKKEEEVPQILWHRGRRRTGKGKSLWWCGCQKDEEQDYPRIRKEFGIVWLRLVYLLPK